MILFTRSLFVCLIGSLFLSQQSAAQSLQFSEAYNELQHQRAMYEFPASKWDSLRCAWFGDCKPEQSGFTASTNSCPLTKRMFGWHAIGSSSTSYQWGLLSDLSYFSYDVDPANGNAKNPTQIAAFPTDPTVVTAISNGVRVNLCVTLFNNTNEFSTFFANATAQTTLINNLIASVVAANAKGINIDFEGSGLSTTYLSQFTSFMSTLSAQLHSTVPESELTIDLQGGYANSSALLTPLLSSVDYFILMGYDYYWSGQFYPGPIAPTYQFPTGAGDTNGHGNVSNDLNNLIRYVGAARAILGMPYYGRRWRTTNGCVIPATGSAASISTQTYTQFRQNTSGYYSNTLRDLNSFAAYHCFNDVNAVPNQQFIDDSFSLQKKYNLIFQRGIAGAAVWRLGYDAGYNECWNLVNNNLSNCPVVLATDTLYDMGGPNGNYHNNENYTFTIAPAGANSVTVSFLSFEMEANYDSLFIYNGNSITSPLIGAFSGAVIPANVTAQSGKMTIRFHSDGGTTKPGYKAVYTSTMGPLVFRSISSGNWSNAAIWNMGTVPTATDSVIVMPSHVVLSDISFAVKDLFLSSTASLNLTNAVTTITIGNNSDKTHNFTCDGSLNVSDGNLLIYGKLVMTNGSHFNLTGGKITIDGNSGSAATSITDGQHLFNIATLPGDFAFSAGTLQFIDPPLGLNSQTISCPYDFGDLSKVVFGDGISTTVSNNPNGFGGDLLPSKLGEVLLDAATTGNNRIFKNLNPLTIKNKCEVRSGNLVEGNALQILQ